MSRPFLKIIWYLEINANAILGHFSHFKTILRNTVLVLQTIFEHCLKYQFCKTFWCVKTILIIEFIYMYMHVPYLFENRLLLQSIFWRCFEFLDFFAYFFMCIFSRLIFWKVFDIRTIPKIVTYLEFWFLPKNLKKWIKLSYFVKITSRSHYM